MAAFSLITIPFCWGTDALTLADYSTLKASIEQAQPLELVQQQWDALISAQPVHRMQYASELIATAQTTKTTLQAELAELGDKSYNVSALKRAFGYLAATVWCTAGLLFDLENLFEIKRGIMWNNDTAAAILQPLCGFIACYYEYEPNPYQHPAFIFFALIHATAPYWLYKASHNTIYKALNYKKNLETGIANLESAIEFLQPYADEQLLQPNEELL